MISSIIEKNENFLTHYQRDLQSNIFSPHKKDHTLLLFINFSETDKDRSWVIDILSSFGNNIDERQGLYISSTEIARASRTLNDYEQEQDLYFNIYLSKEGLILLGCQDNSWQEILANLNQDQDLIGQEQLTEDNSTIHAVFLLAHQQKDVLINQKENIEGLLSLAKSRIIHSEFGQVYRKQFYPEQTNGFAIEHFGYADGISNPWVTKENTSIKGKTKTSTYWDSRCSAEDFLVDEPNHHNELRYGSYLAFRKYQQHVDKFLLHKKALAQHTGFSEDAAAALIFGRKTNGDPIETIIKERLISLNDFNFGTDKCPVFSHIRKVNPRNYQASAPILRRGVTYGFRQPKNNLYNVSFDADKIPEQEVGLLFMSFQKDLGIFQDILVQSQAGETNVDPILGSLTKNPMEMIHHILNVKDASNNKPYTGLGGLISLKGGINLYAPSISFFKDLNLQKTLI